MNNLEETLENKCNRCVGYNKNNKKCRAKTKNNSLFCCKSHEPLNTEIKDGCCICMDIIQNSSDIIFFKCKHAFHKQCYNEWLIYSTYLTPICMICRNEIKSQVKINKKNKKYKKFLLLN